MRDDLCERGGGRRKAEEEEEERGGAAKKQEPHTAMWGKIHQTGQVAAVTTALLKNEWVETILPHPDLGKQVTLRHTHTHDASVRVTAVIP